MWFFINYLWLRVCVIIIPTEKNIKFYILDLGCSFKNQRKYIWWFFIVYIRTYIVDCDTLFISEIIFNDFVNFFIT